MKCPFLRDARVKSCQASAWRKMIPDTSPPAPDERCSSSAWTGCPAAAGHLTPPMEGERCPLLLEYHVEYCSLAEVPRFIPASHDPLSRCRSGGHLYCETYLAQADPRGDRLPVPGGRRRPYAVGRGTQRIDGLPFPAHLFYCSNHMWVDVAEDGLCHVGIDAFLARALGAVETISFVTTPSIERPVAVLTVGGVDLQMVFPNPLQRKVPNAYLRTHPEKLTSDPYGAGWLFEGFERSTTSPKGGGVREGLIPGSEVADWLRSEQQRITAFAHRQSEAAGLMPDGGDAIPGLASHLDRDGVIHLFNEFFAPVVEPRRFR